jgi:hypothetical protein
VVSKKSHHQFRKLCQSLQELRGGGCHSQAVTDFSPATFRQRLHLLSALDAGASDTERKTLEVSAASPTVTTTTARRR